MLNSLGDGSFGNVFKAQDRESGQVVAIKQFKRKYKSWEEAMSLPEVKALIQLVHPNIVKLLEVIRHEDGLYMVFELLEKDMFKAIRTRYK